MTRFVLSPLARADLEEIWDYSETRWGAVQAERYLRDIQSAIGMIAEDPRRGRSCNEIRPGYFKFRVGSHVLFYRLKAKKIDVVRILHQQMDFERHL